MATKSFDDYLARRADERSPEEQAMFDTAYAWLVAQEEGTLGQSQPPASRWD